MTTFYGYQIVHDDIYDFGVATDEGQAWRNLVSDLRDVEKYGGSLDRIEVGHIKAETKDEAMDKIRADEWDFVVAVNGHEEE